ncbi:hypothetical protein F5884DRAFT_801521 [Xylogone sp. PMI_703]|nr:hypothetical protein F5884DRAFT_801521 [Xylogone sp. PMI_703]
MNLCTPSHTSESHIESSNTPQSPQIVPRPGQHSFDVWPTAQTSVEVETDPLLNLEDDWFRTLPDWGGQDGDFISRLTPFPLALDPNFYQLRPHQQLSQSLLSEEQTVPLMLSPASSINYRPQKPDNPGVSEPTANRDVLSRKITSISFTKTKQCWTLPSATQHRAGGELWEGVLKSKRMNLLCNRDANNYIGGGRAKRLKFNEVSRQRLQAALRSNKHKFSSLSESSNRPERESTCLTNTFSQISQGDIPTTTLLDIALDVYFGNCTGKLPIVHSATFMTEAASPSFLLAALLFGFLMFRSKGAPEYVTQTFPVLVSMTLDELQSLSNDPEQPIKSLNAMTTALLTLHLGVLLEKLGMDTQLDVLTATLFTTAEDNGLFAATETFLLPDFLCNTAPLEVQWTTWARAESVKRLVVGLINFDCYRTMRFSKPSLIKPSLVKFFQPSEDILYEADTAAIWLRLVKRGNNPHLPLTGISGDTTNKTEMSTQGICCVLSLILATIGGQNYRFEDFVGNFNEDLSLSSNLSLNKTLITQTIQLFPCSQKSQEPHDINTLILWHSTCVMLASDSQLFECALGLHGSSISSEALQRISKWATTATARRACLHAGAIFNLLQHRRLSDHVSFSTAVGTFRAAIILGLYYLTIPSHLHSIEEHSLDLLSNFDWKEIGLVGFPILSDTQVNGVSFSEETAGVIRFIQHGGTPHLSGHLHPAGNNTAARIFVHFADMIDGLGRWSPVFFSQCLRAMSGDLMQFDSC